MDNHRNYRIVWVHGIGVHPPGYSAAWEAAYDPNLHLGHAGYVEVCWDTVFGTPAHEADRAMLPPPIELTAEEQVREREVRRDLAAALLARAWAMADGASESALLATPEPSPSVLEWSQRADAQFAERGLLPDWLIDPEAYLGDFTRYLVSPRVRKAVKERFKEQLRPLANPEYRVSVIAHSWGTVVAYEGLIDLETEGVGLQVANLFTLGSPLWLVRTLLADTSGRKPRDIAQWTNISARGDAIGSWLSPNFDVDKDFQVLGRGPDAHGSYFVADNEEVQHDLVAHMIIEAPPTGQQVHVTASS